MNPGIVRRVEPPKNRITRQLLTHLGTPDKVLVRRGSIPEAGMEPLEFIDLSMIQLSREHSVAYEKLRVLLRPSLVPSELLHKIGMYAARTVMHIWSSNRPEKAHLADVMDIKRRWLEGTVSDNALKFAINRVERDGEAMLFTSIDSLDDLPVKLSKNEKSATLHSFHSFVSALAPGVGSALPPPDMVETVLDKDGGPSGACWGAVACAVRACAFANSEDKIDYAAQTRAARDYLRVTKELLLRERAKASKEETEARPD